MMASTTMGGWANRALMALACIMVMLVLSLGLGIRSPAARGISAGVAEQQISSTHGAPSRPHRLCPHGGLSQSSGTCAAGGFAALDQPTAGETAPAEPRASRFAITADSAVVKYHQSRLERPPRS